MLVDAGADYHGYVSDITRTWPVNGCFTSPQRDLYSALLEVQETAVEVSSAPSCVRVTVRGCDVRVRCVSGVVLVGMWE